MDQREAAYRIIFAVLEEKKLSHLVMQDFFEEHSGFEARERGFITRLSIGTVERKITLDFFLDSVSKTPVSKQKPIVRTILRMAVYQLFYMDSVPDSAAVNEAVKMIRKKGLTGLSGFVNGVLRSILRDKENLLDKADKDLSVKYSMPVWIVDYMKENYSSDFEKILAGLIRNPDITIRVNLSKISAEELIKKLREDGIEAEHGNYPFSLKLKGVNGINSLKAFKDGLFQVQDESSMMPAYMAGLKKDDLIADVCSSPGGKAIQAADIISGGRGKIISRDLTKLKTDVIRENVKRSGFSNIQVSEWDATVLDESLIGKCDVVFADLPCSGLGIIAKKPDIKYNISLEKQNELVKIQRQILDTVTCYVKPGGVLMYSTCTINKAENEENTAYICEKFGFAKEFERQFLPGISDCDGFYLSKLIRE